MLTSIERIFILNIKNDTSPERELDIGNYFHNNPEINIHTIDSDCKLSIINIAILSGYYNVVIEQMLKKNEANVFESDKMYHSPFYLASLIYEKDDSAKLLFESIIRHHSFKKNFCDYESIIQKRPKCKNLLDIMGNNSTVSDDNSSSYDTLNFTASTLPKKGDSFQGLPSENEGSQTISEEVKSKKSSQVTRHKNSAFTKI